VGFASVTVTVTTAPSIRVWLERTGLTPRYAAGHSLGEFSAHVAAGSLTLEDALEYIGDEDYVEITPKNIRLRKKILDPTYRK